LTLALTLVAFPNCAAANPVPSPTTGSELVRAKGGEVLKYLAVVLVTAAEVLLSAVLP
jgi:hypothetical protein